MPRRYWLMKCEPDAYTIDDLARDGRTSWEGVRNYQARNFMRDQMQEGDGVLFYASNAVADAAEIQGGSASDRAARRPPHRRDVDRRAGSRGMLWGLPLRPTRRSPGGTSQETNHALTACPRSCLVSRGCGGDPALAERIPCAAHRRRARLPHLRQRRQTGPGAGSAALRLPDGDRRPCVRT